MFQITSKDWLVNQKILPDINSKEYEAFWDYQRDLCLEGCYIDGVFIPPELYWHLNMWKTMVDYTTEIGGKIVVRDELRNPTLRDNEFIIFHAIDKAQRNYKGLAIGGSRRLSKSTAMASYLGYGATLDLNSQNVLVGTNSDDMKVMVNMLDVGLNNLPAAFTWMRVEDNWKQQVTLGIRKKDGTRIPFSRIILRNVDGGNNEEAIAGTKPRRLVIDEAAKNPFLDAYQAAKPGFTTAEGILACSPIISFTGGNAEKFLDARKLMFEVEDFEFLYWQDEDNPKRKHGLFLGNKYRQDAKIDSNLGDYITNKVDFNLHEQHTEIPKDSELFQIPIKVASEEKANKILEESLEKLRKGNDKKKYQKEKMYFPKKVDDIFLNTNVNIFNVDAARSQQNKIKAGGLKGFAVEMVHDVDGIKTKPSNKEIITEWPLKNQNPDAPIVIYEHPIPNPPKFLYVAGCLTPGEKVVTDKGLKSIEDVEEYDKLVNEKGEFVSINAFLTYEKENELVYKFKMSHTYRTTTFTKEHPILISQAIKSNGKIDESKFDFTYVDACNVSPGMWTKIPNFYKSDNNLDFTELWSNFGYRVDRQVPNPLNDPDFWWLVGLFLGDGWCESNGYKLTFSFNSKEVKYFNKFCQIVEKLFNRKVSSRNRMGSCIEASFSLQQLNTFLTDNFGKYAHGKYIPEWAKRIPNNFKKELIAGYIASDGCVHLSTRGYYSIEFVSINQSLLEGIQDILFSLGVVSGMSLLRKSKLHTISKNSVPSKVKDCFHLRCFHYESIRLGRIINDKDDLKLSKINISQDFNRHKSGCFISEDKNYIYFQIKDITTENYTGLVYNFDCETHTFLCHHIMTHNCDPYRFGGQAAYSDSLGSTYIFKRIHSITGESFQDMIVASYTARPEDKGYWQEQTRLLIKYYNAYALSENDELGFIEYMKSKNEAEIYLAPQPNFQKSLVNKSTLSRDFGVSRSSDKVRNFMHGLLKKYMDETIHVEKDEQGNIIKETLGINRIFDYALLEEIIGFSEDSNCDRLVALECALALVNELDPLIGAIKNSKVDSKLKGFYKPQENKSVFSPKKTSMFSSKKRPLFR